MENGEPIAIVLIRRSDAALFCHRRREDKAQYPGLWGAGAGGKIAADEAPGEGAVRELREETGVVADVAPLFAQPFRVGHAEYMLHVFLAHAETVPVPCEREWSEWAWISPDGIREMMVDGAFCPDTAAVLGRYFLEKC